MVVRDWSLLYWIQILLRRAMLNLGFLAIAGMLSQISQASDPLSTEPTRPNGSGSAVPRAKPDLKQVFIPMEDGVKLQAIVAVPSEKAPTGGYPLTVGTLGWGSYLKLEGSGGNSSMGYVSVTYMPRGQSRSEGYSTMMGEQEWKDMSTVISWVIANLPVNPDRIAVRGGSQGGVHSWMAAVLDHRVKTIIPSVSAIDWPGSFFGVDQGAVRQMTPLVVRPTRARSNGFLEQLWEAALDERWEVLKPIFQQRQLTDEMIDRVKVPVFVLHAWQDMVFPVDFEVKAFERLAVPKKLYIGVGGHRTPESTEQEETLRRELQLRWLAHWLKGEQNGIMQEKPVTLMLSPVWDRYDFDAFPKPASMRQWYLHADGALSEQLAVDTKTLTIRQEVKQKGLGFRRAFETQFAGITQAIPQDRLIFETKAFEEAVVVIGKPELRLSIKPNSRSFQLVALLKDVSPEGKTFLISRFSIASKAAEPLMTKSVTLPSRLIGHKFHQGHKLKLELMNYDAGEVNDQDMYVPLFEPFAVELSLSGEGECSLILPVGFQP